MKYYLGLIVDWFLLVLVDVAACGFIGLVLYNTLKLKKIPLFLILILIVCFIAILVFAYFFCFEEVEDEDEEEYEEDEKDSESEVKEIINREQENIIEGNKASEAAPAIPENQNLEQTKVFNKKELTEQTKEEDKKDNNDDYPFPII